MFDKTIIIQAPYWISVKEQLPKMFKNVIVWGCREKENILRQAYEARRWTGCNHAFDIEGEAIWEWLTPCDGVVQDVVCWMPMPDTIPPQYFKDPRSGIVRKAIGFFGGKLANKSMHPSENRG